MDAVFKKISIALWGAICFFATIDTGFFVYPSLSQSLLECCCALFLMIVGILYLFRLKNRTGIGKIELLVILWVGYLLLHSLFMQRTEHYRFMYILTTLLLMPVLAQMLRGKLLTVRQLENGCLLILILHLGCLMLQSIGVMASKNVFFALTGCNENPNVTAMLVAVCVPIVYSRLVTSNHTWIMLISLILSVVFLYFLKCRTAFLALGIITFIKIMAVHRVRNFLWTLRKKEIVCIVATVAVLVLIVGNVLYKSKRDSSDGRIFIWKISTLMIAENPFGCGVGMFQREYNYRQGDYFQSYTATEVEKRNADVIYMAYNDYLEHGVEAGIVGVLFMLFFFSSVLLCAYRQRNVSAFAVLSAFAIMQMTNFVYSSIQAWIVLIVYASDVMSKERTFGGRKIQQGFLMLFLTISSVMMSVECNYVVAQIRLKQLIEKTKADVSDCNAKLIGDLLDIRSRVGTSEAYWNALADMYMKQGKHDKAMECMKNVLCYTSDARCLFKAFVCFDKCGRTSEGIKYIKNISDMIPQNLQSRYILMMWYARNRNIPAALRYAHDIDMISLKIQNAKSNYIKSVARQFIDDNENRIKK